MSVRLSLALVALGMEACGRPMAGSGEGVPPQVELEGVRVRYYQGGQGVAQSRAARVTFQRESTDFTAHDVFVRFSGHGQLSGRAGQSEVRASRVEGNLATRKAEGLDGVGLKTGSGLVGQTPHAYFDGVLQEAHGSDPVSVWGPGYQLSAKGFRVQLSEEQLEFGSDVRSQLGDGR